VRSKLLRLSIASLFGIAALVMPAAATEVSVILSGSDFNGGPAFELTLGGKVIGTGVLDPIPADGQASIFAFDVPDHLLSGNGELRVRMTNDAFGGPGKDRNLYVFGAMVDGQRIPVSDFAILQKGKPIKRKVKVNHIDVWSNQEVAVAPAPKGGWLGTSTDAPTVAAPAAVEVKAITKPTEAAVVPLRVAKVPPASAPPAAPAATPAVAAKTTPAVLCNAKASVVGIDTVSAPLSARQLTSLQAVSAQAQTGGCKIELVGYASQGGSDVANLAASVARAKLVLSALQSGGAQFAAVDLKGAGATSDFGSDDRSNRRVEVRLVPAS
jgi:outer membrane protein OmpA-like peptidoglycan-associated protein